MFVNLNMINERIILVCVRVWVYVCLGVRLRALSIETVLARRESKSERVIEWLTEDIWESGEI